MTRPVRWELHILPMMRMIDRDHMVRLAVPRRLDLFDYDEVRARAKIFLQQVADGHMPPPTAGGPWPDEWIALFRRWIDEGFQRLARPVARDPRAVRTGTRVKLSAAVDVSSIDDSVWFDRASTSESPREYYIWHEVIGQDDPQELTAIETFEAGDATSVVIIDANGRMELPIG
jgi:hypothetical protein